MDPDLAVGGFSALKRGAPGGGRGGGGGSGKFVTTDAGWTVSGTSVNSLLTRSTGPRLQVKIGTSSASWTTSTVAPDAGNGGGSTSNGGNGTIFFRTSAYNDATTWSTGSGTLLVPASSNFESVGYASKPDEHVARIIWNWDSSNSRVESWEMLLNTSLLARINPGWTTTGEIPGLGAPIIITVQDGSNSYTNALVTTVPEPTSLVLVGLGGLALLARRRHRSSIA